MKVMEAKENKNITPFEQHLEKRYGKAGTEKRVDFEIKATAFAMEELAKEKQTHPDQ
jgi:hypothetical protein